MPIQVEWDNDEKTVIRWNFQGPWTAQELQETIQKSNERINTQDHIVNHIIDFSQTKTVPPHVISLARFAMHQMPKNLGQIVMIGSGGLFELLIETMRRFSWFSSKIHYVRSDAEAQTYIRSLGAIKGVVESNY